MKYKFPIALFFILAAINIANALPSINNISSYTDSLKFVKTDTGKVNRLNIISKYYLEFDLDKSLDFCNQAFLLSKKIKYVEGEGRALDIKSMIFDKIGEANEALDYKYKAINKYKSANYGYGLCTAINNLGVIFFRQKDYKKAIQCYEEAYEMANENNYVDMKAICLLNIGESNLKSNNLSKALDYEEQSLKISTANHFDAEIGFAKGIIGQIYLMKGLCLLASKEIKDAIQHFFVSNENTAIAEYQIEIAKVQFCLGNSDSAISALKQSLIISGLLNTKTWKAKAYEQFAIIYADKKQFDKALYYEKLVNQINDSIYTETNALKTAQVQILYETEKKESQIKLLVTEGEKREVELALQKKLTYLVILGLFIISILAIGLFRANNKRTKINNELIATNKEISHQKDELNTLNHEINTINEQLEKSLGQLAIEKNNSEKLLLNILPQTVATEIIAKGSVSPQKYESVTILFADFVNFTQYASKNTPGTIIEKLNEFFVAFDDICEKHHLEKIKTIGDCYMAAGGLPISNNTHAIDTANAALEILSYAKNKGWEIRIGIHTGPVIAGVIGKRKFAYDIWGDSVNIASRIVTASEINQINVSQATYSLISGTYKFSHRGKINTKNRGEIDMYFLESDQL